MRRQQPRREALNPLRAGRRAVFPRVERKAESGGCGGWRCFRARRDPFGQEDGRGVALEADVESARVNLGCVGHGEDGLEADALATYNRNGGAFFFKPQQNRSLPNQATSYF